MILTRENYFSPEAMCEYMSTSQYLSFQRCESAALAELNGEYQREITPALLQGGYIDAHVEGTLDLFKAKHPEMFSSRGPTAGQLKAEFRNLDDVIARFERDPVFMSYLEGEKQSIVTGVIGGVAWKGKIDVLHPDRIVDMKALKDFKWIWSEEDGGRVSFVEFWGYSEQGAIYQELCRQMTGKKLPVFLACVTKEKTPDIDILSIPDETLAVKLAEVEYFGKRYAEMKLGQGEPERCGKCDWCKSTKVLTGPVNYLEVGV